MSGTLVNLRLAGAGPTGREKVRRFFNPKTKAEKTEGDSTGENDRDWREIQRLEERLRKLLTQRSLFTCFEVIANSGSANRRP